MIKKFKIQSRKVNFSGFNGNQLAASLDFPQGIPPICYVIISHCFTCSKQTLTTARLGRGLVQAGYGVLRFDFSGLGESEGQFAETHFSSMVEDINCAANWLASHYEPAKALIGHSMGGTASLAAAGNNVAALAQLEHLVTLASPAQPAHLLHHFGPVMQKLQRGEDAEIVVAGQAYPVTPAFVDDVQSYDIAKQMSHCDLPVLVVRAADDELVGPENAEQILQYGKGKNQLCEIAGANHLFSNREHAQQLLSHVLDWL